MTGVDEVDGNYVVPWLYNPSWNVRSCRQRRKAFNEFHCLTYESILMPQTQWQSAEQRRKK